jgi:hypothetical protein
VQFVLLHIPHLLPVIVGVAFLGRFGLYAMRLPPAHLNDEELAAWTRDHDARRVAPRAVSRAAARLSMVALVPLLVAFGTGLAIYTVDLRGHPSSAAMTWIHAGSAVVGLAAATAKLAPLGRDRLREALAPARWATDGLSVALAVAGIPLLVTGSVLLASPDGTVRRVHLVVSAAWMVAFQIHVLRYLGRALRSTRFDPPPRRAERSQSA